MSAVAVIITSQGLVHLSPFPTDQGDSVWTVTVMIQQSTAAAWQIIYHFSSTNNQMLHLDWSSGAVSRLILYLDWSSGAVSRLILYLDWSSGAVSRLILYLDWSSGAVSRLILYLDWSSGAVSRLTFRCCILTDHQVPCLDWSSGVVSRLIIGCCISTDHQVQYLNWYVVCNWQTPQKSWTHKLLCAKCRQKEKSLLASPVRETGPWT